MLFNISHTFREGNVCANKLATHGLTCQGIVWWDLVPIFIKEEFNRNRLSLPSFRLRKSFILL